MENVTLPKSLKDFLNNLLPISNVVNNVTTNSSGYALDARQGKNLQDQISAFPSLIQSGKTSAQSIPTMERGTFEITFSKPFKSIDYSTVGILRYSTDNTALGNVILVLRSNSATDAKFYVYNNSTSTKSVYIEWIAVSNY